MNNKRKAAVLLLCWAAIGTSQLSAQQFVVGVVTHFGQNRGNPERTLTMIQQAGLSSIRDDVYWKFVEKEKGVLVLPDALTRLEKAVDVSLAKGIEPLIVLGNENKLHDKHLPLSEAAQLAYVEYVKHIVAHFKGKVRLYEVFNEWNTKGTPQDYSRLLKKTYPVIKKEDPSAIVLAGAIEGVQTKWTRSLLEENVADYMDGLSIHPYNFWQGPKGTPERLVQWLGELKEELQGYFSSGEVPIYITEIGWPSNKGDYYGVAPTTQADYLARFLLSSRTLDFLKGVWWYNFRNNGLNAESRYHNFGLVLNDYDLKPTYDVMKDIAPIVRSMQRIERIKTSENVWAFRITRIAGKEVLSAWTSAPVEKWAMRVASDGAAKATLVTKYAGRDETSKAYVFRSGDTSVDFPLRERPVLVTGDLAHIKVTFETVTEKPTATLNTDRGLK